MFYKCTTPGNSSRTSNYMGTTDSKTDSDVLALKADVAKYNKEVRASVYPKMAVGDFDRALQYLAWSPIQRVRFMARGTRQDSDGNPLHTSASTTLRHEFAKVFDVYRVEDTTATYELRQAIRCECRTIGQYRVERDAAAKVRQARFDAANELAQTLNISVWDAFQRITSNSEYN